MHTTHESGLRRRILSFVATAACMMLALAPVRGAVVPLEMEKLVAIADEVVAVRVVENKPRFIDGMVVTECDLVVHETFKGKMAGAQKVTIPGGNYKGLVMDVPGVPRLEKGRDMVLFLSYPEQRLPEASRKSLNPNSPLVTSPKVVGGWQGKFLLEGEAGGLAKSAGPDATAAVVRTAAGTVPTSVVGKAPSYGQFAGAVRELVAAQKSAEASKAPRRAIKGVNGEWAVASRSDNSVVRAFDPLPPLAYATSEEVKALQKQIDGQANESPAAGEE